MFASIQSKKRLSKDALKQIRKKRKVYKCTGNNEGYIIFKEALKETTQEIRKAKLGIEHRLAANIKEDSKRFFSHTLEVSGKWKAGYVHDTDGSVIAKSVDVRIKCVLSNSYSNAYSNDNHLNAIRIRLKDYYSSPSFEKNSKTECNDRFITYYDNKKSL